MIPVIGWDATDAEWLTARQAGLGASEVASALGLEGAYETPWQVWARKTGRLTASTDVSDAMTLGVELEPWLVEQASRLTGMVVYQSSARLYRSKSAPWMLASPDALASPGARSDHGGFISADAPVDLVECKTAGLYEPMAARDWTEDLPPLRYEVQAIWQMAVTGIRSRVHIVALVPPWGLRCWVVEWDAAAEHALVDRATDWWETHVVGDREPALAAADDKIMSVMYADPVEGVAEIDPGLHARYLSARAIRADADKRLSVVRAELKRALAGRSEGRADGRPVASYRPDVNGVRRLWVAGEE